MAEATQLNLDNLNTDEKQFKAALESAGIPVTEDGLKEEFEKIVNNSELEITNTSAFSPFWNLIKSLITTPVFWLICFLIRYVMPSAYAKTASGYFLDLIAWVYKVSRKDAAKTQGIITFSRTSAGQPLSIPAGTVVRTVAINGTIYRMITDKDTAFSTDSKTVNVNASAENTGEAYNLAPGYYSIIESEVTGVDSAVNGDNWITSPGQDKESDDDLRGRVRNQFTAAAAWHIDAKYKAMISEQTGFKADRIFFDHDIPRGPGSADAYILFDTYTPSQNYLDKINKYIMNDGNHGHGDDLLVKAVPYEKHNIAVTVYFSGTLTSDKKTELKSNIENFIRCAFRENTDYRKYVSPTWPYSRFSFAVLDQELLNYFDGVESFVWGQPDIVSQLNIPEIKTLTVNEGTDSYGRRAGIKTP